MPINLSQMSQKTSSHSQASVPLKKRSSTGVFGDVLYGTMMFPKELEIVKETNFELGFQVPDLGCIVKDFLKTREVREFVSGALAGAMTKAVLAPLETIRTRMVVGVGSKHIAGSFIEVIEQQGWQGLWAGNAINMLRIIPTQAIELGTFECVKRAMTSAQEKWNQTECPRVQIGPVGLNFSLSWISPVAVAGAAAGIVSTLVCHPLEVLKDRLTISREVYPSLSIAISKIYKDGGIGAFYAGFTASTISFPLEVARKRLMVGALEGKCPPHMAAALSEVIKEKGLMGLYRGWGASCLKVMPSSGITWMFYEAWKDILLVEKGHL
ncbi:hypothetical protein I3760_01G205100 [Carya illinoinensis]|uniref:Mitochondrial adenine nucleotide transporter BTL1 n=1 Tax=Carya illinoinensis TaxID=32201 RepID=A0A922K4Y5_CARIL|nr:probable mitochondrial adenine nucleotide transporter BTL1 isoform X4 [Carya illinoinensis]KAG2728439.1 hypothetical protein I3760_01G205100 [Carya illinoinensis]KAG6733073.1 hypothetical protein I3842_01G208500 [Carya illinoinensis]